MPNDSITPSTLGRVPQGGTQCLLDIGPLEQMNASQVQADRRSFRGHLVLHAACNCCSAWHRHSSHGTR